MTEALSSGSLLKHCQQPLGDPLTTVATAARYELQEVTLSDIIAAEAADVFTTTCSHAPLTRPAESPLLSSPLLSVLTHHSLMSE